MKRRFLVPLLVGGAVEVPMAIALATVTLSHADCGDYQGPDCFEGLLNFTIPWIEGAMLMIGVLSLLASAALWRRDRRS